jgi:phosphate butyryltransferase
VAGNADILIFPELVSGNVFYKTSTFLSHIYSAAVVVGAKCPIIVTSRADNAQTKLNSIMLGTILVCN